MQEIFVVMATSGEYSDRSEWPVVAYTTIEKAQAKVDDLGIAKQQIPPMPNYPFGSYSGNNYESPEYCKYEEECKAREDEAMRLIGRSDDDIMWFIYNVKIES